MDKDLLCAESGADCRIAEKDNVILNDDRVLDHLLESEMMYMPQKDYFKKNDLDPVNRKLATKWMLEVISSFKSHSVVNRIRTVLFARKYALRLEFYQFCLAKLIVRRVL